MVGSKLQAKRQDQKVVWVVLNLSSEARQEDEENTVNVCLRIITLVLEEFKAKTFARKTTLTSSEI